MLANTKAHSLSTNRGGGHLETDGYESLSLLNNSVQKSGEANTTRLSSKSATLAKVDDLTERVEQDPP